MSNVDLSSVCFLKADEISCYTITYAYECDVIQ